MLLFWVLFVDVLDCAVVVFLSLVVGLPGGFLGATLFACGSLLCAAWFGLVVAGFRRVDF